MWRWSCRPSRRDGSCMRGAPRRARGAVARSARNFLTANEIMARSGISGRFRETRMMAVRPFAPAGRCAPAHQAQLPISHRSGFDLAWKEAAVPRCSSFPANSRNTGPCATHNNRNKSMTFQRITSGHGCSVLVAAPPCGRPAHVGQCTSRASPSTRTVWAAEKIKNAVRAATRSRCTPRAAGQKRHHPGPDLGRGIITRAPALRTRPFRESVSLLPLHLPNVDHCGYTKRHLQIWTAGYEQKSGNQIIATTPAPPNTSTNHASAPP